jgi:hypothetical protein
MKLRETVVENMNRKLRYLGLEWQYPACMNPIRTHEKSTISRTPMNTK